MALKDILQKMQNSKKFKNKLGVSEERINAILPIFGKYVGFFRQYPDIFIDLITPPNSNFKLYFYQRLFLRNALRKRYLYATFPRAFSKSFLSILALVLKCILYPGAKLFIVSGGKEQATNIAKEKFEEILELIPTLKSEIDFKQCLFARNYVKIVFKNGSRFDVVAMKDSTRGGRRHGGLIEEAILIDGQKLNEVIIPLMNVSRRKKDGSVDPKEKLNKSQIYITTAGYKDSFAYEKKIQTLVWQIINPDEAAVMTGTWRIPVLHGLLDKNFVKELKADGTFNEASFAREYESEWAGTVEGSFFKPELFDKCRTVVVPEYEATIQKTTYPNGKMPYYILSADVGRLNCQSVVTVFKVVPQVDTFTMNPTSSLKYLVNIFTFDDEHFEDQALKIKRLFFNNFKAKALVLDGNGLGIGLVDYLIRPTYDPLLGDHYPGMGVINDDNHYYDKYYQDNTIRDLLYVMKANEEINNDAHVNVLSQMASNKVRLLIDEGAAKARLLSTKNGQNMTAAQRAEHLKPFTLTSILREEMLNLKEHREGALIKLTQINTNIKKDKFSAFEYGLYYIKKLDDENHKKRRGKIKDFIFYTPRN